MINSPISSLDCRPIQSWDDLEESEPRNPLDLIADASIVGISGTDSGVFLNSDTYNPAGTVWTPGTLPIQSKPVCVALETTNAQAIADANDWNASHLTWNSSADVPPPL